MFPIFCCNSHSYGSSLDTQSSDHSFSNVLLSYSARSRQKVHTDMTALDKVLVPCVTCDGCLIAAAQPLVTKLLLLDVLESMVLVLEIVPLMDGGSLMSLNTGCKRIYFSLCMLALRHLSDCRPDGQGVCLGLLICGGSQQTALLSSALGPHVLRLEWISY